MPNKLVNNNNMPRTKNAPKKRINEEVSNTKINNDNDNNSNTKKKQRVNVHDIEIDENYIVLSTQGKRATMEDSYDVFIDHDDIFNIFSVFDGHGGYECAEFCKLNFNKELYKNMIQTVTEDNNNNNNDDDNNNINTKTIHTVIENTFHEIDKSYCKLCETDETRIDGSTATIVIHDIKNNKLHCASVGDSLAVLFRYGFNDTNSHSNDGEIKLLNDIHLASDYDEKKRVVEAGGKIVDKNGISRVEGVLMVSRSIGDSYLKKLISSSPSISSHQITNEEQERLVIIGSDGLFDFIEPPELCNMFRQCNDLNDVQACVQRCVGTSISRGSSDNITLIAIPICEKLKSKKRSDSLCS